MSWCSAGICLYRRACVKLVKFEDGTYGVRVHWLFGWWFKDLAHPSYSWTKGNSYFKDCKGSYLEAERVYNSLNSKHTVIK